MRVAPSRPARGAAAMPRRTGRQSQCAAGTGAHCVSRRLWLAAAVGVGSGGSAYGASTSGREGGSLPQQESARELVLRLLSQGYNNYNPGAELGDAVEALIRSQAAATSALAPTSLAGASMRLGPGTWEVFYAPHISRMSSALGTRFEPIRYVLFEDGALSSNVQYSNPLLGRGWLSASGSIQPADASTLELHFDKFWWDGGTDTLRPLLGGGGGGDGQQFEDASLPQPSAADAAVTSLGRTGFVRQLALFPVLYVDEELAVFKFPPLDSNIAIHKVAPPARRPLRS